VNRSQPSLSAVLRLACRNCCHPFEPIAVGGGYALDRGPGIIELIPETAVGAPTIISAGVHGNETAPLELLLALAEALDAGQLRVAAHTLLIVGHPSSIPAGQRYLETNLNRLFRRGVPQPCDDTLEQRRAAVLMAAVDAFWSAHQRPAPDAATAADVALHLDLHTAIRTSEYPRFAVEPFAEVATPASVWRALAGSGLQAVLSQHRHSWTFSHYSRYYHGVVAFTLELGRVAAFGANDLAPLAGVQALLIARVAGHDSRLASADTLCYFYVVQELMRESDDFALFFADDTPNFTAFDVGTTIARDGLAGDTVVAEAPIHVVFPNARVELGARAALLARPGKPPA
jgi:succinylglutamate desuccinylase